MPSASPPSAAPAKASSVIFKVISRLGSSEPKSATRVCAIRTGDGRT